MHASDVEQRIASFIEKYTPSMAAQIQEARSRLLSHFPRGFELVFENYNALVFGISPTEKSSQSFLSIAAYPRWLTLFFLHGASLNDPSNLLQGAGSQVRSIRLASPVEFEESGVQALVSQAVKPHIELLLAAPSLTTIIKMVAAKQRPRRPSEAAAIVRARKNAA